MPVVLEHVHDVGVLGQAAGSDDGEPFGHGLAVGGFDVADLGLEAFFDCCHWWWSFADQAVACAGGRALLASAGPAAA
jgi:hypothetical protein